MSQAQETPPTTVRQKFENPYGPEPEKRQIVFDVSKNDHNQIKCTRPGSGTLSAFAGILWKKGVIALSERQLTDVTKENEFEDFIRDCVIISREEYEKLCQDSLKFNMKPLEAATPISGRAAKKGKGSDGQ